ALLLAALEERQNIARQTAKLIGTHLPALQSLPFGAQRGRFLAQLSHYRRTVLDQVHGAVGRLVSQPDHIVETVGSIRYLRVLNAIRAERARRVQLEVDNRVMQ